MNKYPTPYPGDLITWKDSYMHFSLYPEFKSFTSTSFASYTKFGSLCLYLNSVDYIIRFRISAWNFQTATSLVIFR